jgi:hypothetical protein
MVDGLRKLGVENVPAIATGGVQAIINPVAIR